MAAHNSDLRLATGAEIHSVTGRRGTPNRSKMNRPAIRVWHETCCVRAGVGEQSVTPVGSAPTGHGRWLAGARAAHTEAFRSSPQQLRELERGVGRRAGCKSSPRAQAPQGHNGRADGWMCSGGRGHAVNAVCWLACAGGICQPARPAQGWH